MPEPPTRSAIKRDLFADSTRLAKLDALSDPLEPIARGAWTLNTWAPWSTSCCHAVTAKKGAAHPIPCEVMPRILVVKYLNGLSDEQMQFQRLDRMSYRRFCLLEHSANVPDRNTLWHWQQRLGADGTTALFQAIDGQLLEPGYIARQGPVIDATLVPAPIQHFIQQDKHPLDKGHIPSDCSEAKRRQKGIEAPHTKKHGSFREGTTLFRFVTKNRYQRALGARMAENAKAMPKKIGSLTVPFRHIRSDAEIEGLILFLNQTCTLSASLAVRLYCPRFTFASTFDLEME